MPAEAWLARRAKRAGQQSPLDGPEDSGEETVSPAKANVGAGIRASDVATRFQDRPETALLKRKPAICKELGGFGGDNQQGSSGQSEGRRATWRTAWQAIWQEGRQEGQQTPLRQGPASDC